MFSQDAQWSTRAAVVAKNFMHVALVPILNELTRKQNTLGTLQRYDWLHASSVPISVVHIFLLLWCSSTLIAYIVVKLNVDRLNFYWIEDCRIWRRQLCTQQNSDPHFSITCSIRSSLCFDQRKFKGQLARTDGLQLEKVEHTLLPACTCNYTDCMLVRSNYFLIKTSVCPRSVLLFLIMSIFTVLFSSFYLFSWFVLWSLLFIDSEVVKLLDIAKQCGTLSPHTECLHTWTPFLFKPLQCLQGPVLGFWSCTFNLTVSKFRRFAFITTYSDSLAPPVVPPPTLSLNALSSSCSMTKKKKHERSEYDVFSTFLTTLVAMCFGFCEG